MAWSSAALYSMGGIALRSDMVLKPFPPAEERAPVWSAALLPGGNSGWPRASSPL